MAFLDKATETLNNVSKDVLDKAKEIKELVGLTNQVASQENLIEKYYKELGQFVYEHKDEEIAEGIAERVTLIDAAFEEAARLKKELLKKKGYKACENCGFEMDKDAAFCSKCGAPAPVIEEEPVEEAAEEAECCCGTEEAECCCSSEETECCCSSEETECCCDSDVKEENCCCASNEEV